MNEIGIEVGAARTGSQPHCPFCRENLADLPTCECSACRVGYHLECAQELKSCATVGCEGAFRALCPGCQEHLDVQTKAACDACARVYHSRCRTQAQTCACGASLARERPILRARRGPSLGRQLLNYAVQAYVILMVLAVAGVEIWAMVEVTTRKPRGVDHQDPMLLMLAPLVIGPVLISIPYVLGWKPPE